VNGACGTGITRALGTQLTWGLALSGAVVRERLDLIAEVYGYADVTGSDHAFPLEWLAGGKVYLAAKSYFQFGAGTGIIPGQTGSPVVRGFVGFVFEPPVRERVRAQADEPAITRPTPAPAPPEPPLTKVRVRHGSLQLFEKIYFETAKATIKPISYAILDAVAATLATNPQLDLVEIQGHADERGDDDYNLQLTQDRAQAVKQYLVDHGISADRLMASGYGETRPLCRAHDEDCWSANRRVELIILHQTGAIPGQD
jgi:outer membrane protein OmpA-like peptidoglycan-associated protein